MLRNDVVAPETVEKFLQEQSNMPFVGEVRGKEAEMLLEAMQRSPETQVFTRHVRSLELKNHRKTDSRG